MKTFLFVCKLIGISVAVLLLLLLILGLLFLFHSAKYKLQMKADDELFLRFRIRFLFPLFNFCGDYKNKKAIIKLRILGITVYDMERAERKKEKRQRKKKAGGNEKGKQAETEESYEEWLARRETEKREDTEEKRTDDAADAMGTQEENTAGAAGAAPKDSFFAKYRRMFLKIKEILGKIYNIIKKVPALLSGIMDSIRLLFEKKALLSEFIQDEDVRAFLRLSGQQFLELGKHVKPKKLRGHLIIGTGAPDTTGQLIGVLSLFIPYYGSYLQIIPDFERQRLEGDLYAKGRIRCITVLWILKKWLWNDTMKRSKKRAMQLKEELSHGR